MNGIRLFSQSGYRFALLAGFLPPVFASPRFSYPLNEKDGPQAAFLNSAFLVRLICFHLQFDIDLCTKIYIVAEEYHPSVYAKRNRYMVEHSDRVIAVYDGREKGGTVGTIRLAHRMKKELREIAAGKLYIAEHSMPAFVK